MWRHLTRNLQQRLRRSLCVEKADNSLNDGKPSTSTNRHDNCCIYSQLLLRSRHIFHVDDGQNESNYKKSSRKIGQHSFFEAFGWSGALVFGWTISKQLWLKHIWTREEINRPTEENLSLIELLARIVRTQPPATYVLPLDTKSAFHHSKDVEDEFETAAKELQKVHDKVVGEALNRRGIACLSISTSSEAIKYFKQASEFKYPPASFNMGQCCELGIGTDQDFKEAAEWYRIASDQGHATAMYNLGVFYAHGWGGLQANIDTAKNLFIKAANLGQLDAKAALDQESKCRLSFTNNGELNATNTKSNPFDRPMFANSVNEWVDEVFIRKSCALDNNTWDTHLKTTLSF